MEGKFVVLKYPIGNPEKKDRLETKIVKQLIENI